MCALVPRGQTCWRLGLACVGAQRPDYRWRLEACAPLIDLNLAASLDGNCIGMDGFGRGAEPIGGALQ